MIKLSVKEQVLAAKVFTVENLGGVVEKKTIRGIEDAYRRCENDHAMEGIEIRDEYNSWLIEIASNQGTIEMWEKERVKYPELTTTNSQLSGGV